MHHALEIQEVLSSIFFYCSPPFPGGSYQYKECTADLAALARTCRTFKEPALDALWNSLIDLSPLARCLPEASHRLSSRQKKMVRWLRVFVVFCLVTVSCFFFCHSTEQYSFSRPPNQIEWDTLRSYTRRIRTINGFRTFQSGLDRASFQILSSHSTTEPLFPNLRCLFCEYEKETMPLLNHPLPSLIYLDVRFETSQLFQHSLELFPNFSPEIRTLHIHIPLGHIMMSNNIDSDYIFRWRNIQSLCCPEVALAADVLVYLSHMPALTQLEFMLSVAFPDLGSTLVFSNLYQLTVSSQSLDKILRFLSQTRLPIIMKCHTQFHNRPSRQQLSYFFAWLATSNSGLTINDLVLCQWPRDGVNVVPNLVAPLLDFEDLRRCMAFTGLRQVELNIECTVYLTDNELLTLTSAWLKLETLIINGYHGWGSQGGITPDGLVRLLQTCRQLNRIALCLNARDYTEVPSSHTPTGLGLTLPPEFSIDVLDSAIEIESVPAVTALFTNIATCSDFLRNRYGILELELQRVDEYARRWSDVRNRMFDNLGLRYRYGIWNTSEEDMLSELSSLSS